MVSYHTDIQSHAKTSETKLANYCILETTAVKSVIIDLSSQYQNLVLGQKCTESYIKASNISMHEEADVLYTDYQLIITVIITGILLKYEVSSTNDQTGPRGSLIYPQKYILSRNPHHCTVMWDWIEHVIWANLLLLADIIGFRKTWLALLNFLVGNMYERKWALLMYIYSS